jgi:hypothetical protein
MVAAMGRIAALIVTAGLCGATALFLHATPSLQNAARAVTAHDHPVWTETKWPFPMDQWGEGKAFQCKAADCDADLSLYIRAKIGFCSSTTGVADDDELDRLSDFDFMMGRVMPVADGHDIDVAGLKGRIRAYTTANPVDSRGYAFSVAFNSGSDALVATVLVNGGRPAAVEQVVIQFLNGKTIARWVKLTLGS